MTRENKLALVVGFGLILLVGILISDHFSVASTQAAAQLTRVVDPLTGEDEARADLIALRSEAEPDPVVFARPEDDGGVRPIPSKPAGITLPEGQPNIEMGGEMAGPAVGLSPPDAERLPYTIHLVSDGESLSTICGRHFGDRSLAKFETSESYAGGAGIGGWDMVEMEELLERLGEETAKTVTR